MLKNSESLKYDFEKLTKISIQTSENKKVRIITWQIQFSSGVFSYFGFIQSNANKNDILLYQLNDKSEEISNIENAVFTPEKWYGTLYYKIVTNKYKKDTYYTLLGWDGNDNLTNKKIIDVLYFDSNNNPVFGKPVFSYENKIQNRIIFEYGEQVKMLLNFDEDYKMIIWDHLAPSSPALKDKFQYYGPDFSYDGLKFNKGIWEFYPKITPKNKTDNNSGKKPKSSNNLH